MGLEVAFSFTWHTANRDAANIHFRRIPESNLLDPGLRYTTAVCG